MAARRQLANAIRALAMDAVQQANSGHPGMPMGMADIAEVLYRDFLRHNPQNPNWANRDRFVLSNGHGAILLYAVLHLTGYDLSMDDLRQFRQLHSKTPGHPEYQDTPGVETTTGPLGQGLANAVGMALAEKILASQFNRDGFNIVDHMTYVFTGDGCLMEGISHEVCSLAGTWQLGKLIVFYDDNGISIDGDVRGWFNDDTPKRFSSYHWQVIENVDGHDAAAVQQAIEQAHTDPKRPTLICCKTTIGFGSPNLAGSEKTHGAPLGEAEVKLTRQQLEWPHPPFVIPEDIQQQWDAREQGTDYEDAWNYLFAKYEKQYPQLAAEFLRRQQGWLPDNWQQHAEKFITETQQQQKAVATRKASQQCLEAYAALLPELIGGSADLTGSNCTAWSGSQCFGPQQTDANYIEYGVREFGMSAISNGLALHGGFIPYAGTFLVFSDYARNAVRLSALMQKRVIYVYTHDSIGLGEDGPTHQPIEHAAMLRMTPNMQVWRPCDLTETAVAWQQALNYQGASSLLLSRQSLPPQTRSADTLKTIAKGGYILLDTKNTADGIIIATGSEVHLAMQAAEQLATQNIFIRVVSMPCANVFKQQDAAYQQHVLPNEITALLAVEAGVSDYWYQFVGRQGAVVGIDRFGLSAPADAVFNELGITVERVTQQMLALVRKKKVTDSVETLA